MQKSENKKGKYVQVHTQAMTEDIFYFRIILCKWKDEDRNIEDRQKIFAYLEISCGVISKTVSPENQLFSKQWVTFKDLPKSTTTLFQLRLYGYANGQMEWE